MNRTKQLVTTAMCVALGIVLPMAFHFVPNAGSILLPMHLPVLLCGLVNGPVWGLVAGIATPALSSMMTGMPPAIYLPSMLFELAGYGLVAGLMMKMLLKKRNMRTVYIALIAAMLVGRILYGLSNALIFRVGAYSLEVWFAAAFTTALPGIVLQLVVIPPVVMALQKIKAI